MNFKQGFLGEAENIKAALVQAIPNAMPPSRSASSVSIEAAHVYADQEFAQEHLLSAQLGSFLADSLNTLGYCSSHTLFIDDYNPRKKIIVKNDPASASSLENLNGAGQRYVENLYQAGYAPQRIIWEADLVNEAQNAIEKLKNSGLAQRDQNRISLSDNGMELYNEIEKTFACSLLDAIRAINELQSYDITITVLDMSYEKQQSSMKEVVRALGYNTKRILNLMYRPGSIYLVTDDVRYSILAANA